MQSLDARTAVIALTVEGHARLRVDGIWQWTLGVIQIVPSHRPSHIAAAMALLFFLSFFPPCYSSAYTSTRTLRGPR